ncbi:MAG: hypothetical protein WBS54_15930 [Acidobacteriota bacterium]
MTEPKSSTTATPKPHPDWEIFLVGQDGKILEKTWENQKLGTKGTAWNRLGALWAGTTQEGKPTLSGYLELPGGKRVRLKLFPPRLHGRALPPAR